MRFTRFTMVVILMTAWFAGGCAVTNGGEEARVDHASLPAKSFTGTEPIVYIRGKAVEYGTGRTIANPPPPRKSTAEDELLDETRRKSDVTIWAAVAGPEGKVMWVPVRKPTTR